MSLGRDGVATAIGALAVVLAIGGLAVVEANTGPFEHELEPAEHVTQLEGTYVVREGSASSPLCSSPATEDACDPETELDVTLAGLPALGGEAAYAAFLTDGERNEPLGPLEATGESHRLAFTGDVDADTYGTLLLALVSTDDTATPAFELHARELPTSGGERVSLEESTPVSFAPAEGRLSLAQIGAVEVAVTAEAHLGGLPEGGDWRYEAWLVDGPGTWTSLGPLEAGEEGNHALDARVERVTLAQQERFLVTLEPPDAAPSPGPGGEPGDFPVVETTVQADTLIG